MRVASRRVMLNAQVGNKNRWYEHGKNEGQRKSMEIKRGGGMRKVELSRRIAEATGLSRVKSEEAIDTVLEEIKNRVKRRIFQLVVWCGLNLGMSLGMP